MLPLTDRLSVIDADVTTDSELRLAAPLALIAVVDTLPALKLPLTVAADNSAAPACNVPNSLTVTLLLAIDTFDATSIFPLVLIQPMNAVAVDELAVS